jgi:hypothetical protein
MAQIRKALAAAVAAAATAVLDGLAQGGLSHVNFAIVAGAAIAAGFAVWGIPNAPAARSRIPT